jgi:hypothetical protein
MYFVASSLLIGIFESQLSSIFSVVSLALKRKDAKEFISTMDGHGKTQIQMLQRFYP